MSQALVADNQKSPILAPDLKSDYFIRSLFFFKSCLFIVDEEYFKNLFVFKFFTNLSVTVSCFTGADISILVWKQQA